MNELNMWLFNLCSFTRPKSLRACLAGCCVLFPILCPVLLLLLLLLLQFRVQHCLVLCDQPHATVFLYALSRISLVPRAKHFLSQGAMQHGHRWSEK
jgi:hypothetical protein